MAITACGITVDRYGQEMTRHGTAAFPVACYNDDIFNNPDPCHWHEELEAMIVMEGTLLLNCGSEQYVVHAGEGFFINTGVLHGCWAYQSSKCCVHTVVFHPRLVGGAPDSIFFQKYLQPLMENRINSCLLLSPQISWQAQAIGHIEAAWKAVDQEATGYEFAVWQNLAGMIQLLCNHCLADNKETNHKLQRDHQRIKAMLQFIHEHYAEKITVAEIAQCASISESECLRCFRSTIQRTPNQYLRQYRIQQAANLLVSTEEKISVIAHACGFEDLSFFAKTFRELKGRSPSDYRNHLI